MNSKIPQYNSNAFDCPLCNVYSRMHWTTVRTLQQSSRVDVANCDHCGQDNVWFSILNDFNRILKSEMIFPKFTLNVHPQNDMPDDVKKDFNEAKSIFNESPKAAAALLRLSLQKLCIHLGEKGKNINDDIKELVKKGKLSSDIAQAADTIRITGNNAVHPGEMDDNDIDFIASKMFGLINLIIRKTISEPKEVKELFVLTPEKAREAIVKRDG